MKDQLLIVLCDLTGAITDTECECIEWAINAVGAIIWVVLAQF